MNKKYKVVYLITSLGSGGAQQMLYRMLKRVDRSTYEPVVVTLLNVSGSLKEKIEALGIEVHILDLRAKYCIGNFYRLYRLISKISPDILHTQLYAADILGRITGKITGVPVIITSVRNIYYGGYLRNMFFKWTEKYADKTTFVSRAAADRFKALGIVPQRKQLVIYNGLEPEDFLEGSDKAFKKKKREDLGLPHEGILFLSVGSLTSQKGYPVLFSALADLISEGSNFYLVIAGRGPLAKELQEEALNKGIKEKVIFLGRSDEVPALMAAADALVLSSHWEGMPGVVMEAMASELPVVATAVGGTPELVEDGVSGYLVKAGDPEDLSNALEKIAGLPFEKRREMGQAGRKRVKEYFSAEKMVRGYEDLYYECLEKKN